MRRQGTPPGLLFRLIIPATAVFIITIFALLAAPFGDQDAPVWKFLDRQGDRLLVAEFLVVILLTLFAIVWDRRQILRQASMAQQHESPSETPADPENQDADAADVSLTDPSTRSPGIPPEGS